LPLERQLKVWPGAAQEKLQWQFALIEDPGATLIVGPAYSTMKTLSFLPWKYALFDVTSDSLRIMGVGCSVSGTVARRRG